RVPQQQEHPARQAFDHLIRQNELPVLTWRAEHWGRGPRAVAPLPAVVLREGAIGGRDAVPGPGTGLFLAVTLLALLPLVAAVATPAAHGGGQNSGPAAPRGAWDRPARAGSGGRPAGGRGRGGGGATRCRRRPAP